MILQSSGGRLAKEGSGGATGRKDGRGREGPWLGRDGFVAETAVQFDRVNATIARLEREVEKSREALAEMAEEANRVRRLQAFEETIKNSRDYKITDLQRVVPRSQVAARPDRGRQVAPTSG